MFNDLSKIIEKQKKKVKEFTNQKVLLSEEFKSQYLSAMETESSKIDFYDTFAIVTTTKELHIYIPTQWFYLAFIGAPVVKEIVKYREFVKENSKFPSKSQFKDFILDAKEGDLDEDVLSEAVFDLSETEADNIRRFLTDYRWWNGAKDLSRTDYYVSPVLSVLDLVNVSSTYVADISYLLSNNFDLSEDAGKRYFSLIQEEISMLDYESEFRQWIRQTQTSVESKLKYVNTLNRFEKEVNSQLASESFTPMSLWNNPVDFADNYSLGTIMKIAERLQPNTAFVRNDGSPSTELKAIYKKYIEWTSTLGSQSENKLQFFGETDESASLGRFSEQLRSEPRQYIYFGAPGTGKSYQLSNDSAAFGDNIERITFHPNMTYGNFVGVFKPFPQMMEVYNNEGKIVVDESGNPLKEERITYKFIPGILIKQLTKALLNPNTAYLLIIEELNRANVAAVFGDMFQLLDRNKDNFSEYPIGISEDLQQYFSEVYEAQPNEQIKENLRSSLKNGLIFPSNFYIWTTMNSADQGITPMDTAFKRRWEQKYFGIDEAWIKGDGKERFVGYSKIKYRSRVGEVSEVKEISWNAIRRIINDMLMTNKNIPEDKLLGPYFISEKILTSGSEAVTESFKSKVLMYLFDDAAKQNRSLIFKGVDRMLYSEVVRMFEEEGLKLFDISDDDIKRYVKEEQIDSEA